MSALFDNRREPLLHIENASERRVNRQIEESASAYSWMPLAPDLEQTETSRRAAIAWAFGDDDFGIIGRVLECVAIVMVFALATTIVMHQAPFIMSGWACFANAAC